MELAVLKYIAAGLGAGLVVIYFKTASSIVTLLFYLK